MRHDEILGLLHYLLAPGEEASLLWAAHWELAFWAIVLLITLLLALTRPAWLLRAEDGFRRISLHRTACVWGIGGAVIAIRTILLPLIPIPVPVMLDEFSYLLGADTFASGRLTNPPHPMWIHFESFNINMHPTYQSMYPPAQSLVLALGEKLTGEPWFGVLLSVAVMCALFCWMLQGWMPPQWALLGGIYALLRYGVFSYWINSYWGGAMAAIGGALLLGSLPRLRRKLSWQQSALFALGLVILANSRPFEGLLFALPLSLAVLWLGLRLTLHSTLRSTLPRRRILAQLVIPAALLLGLALAWMLYYNWRGTGNALHMPYTINQATYHISKPFLFQKPYPIPVYHNPQMRIFYMLHEYPDLLLSRSAWGLEVLMARKFFCYYVALVWPLLLLFVPGLLLAAWSAELRVVFLAIVLLLLGLTVQLWPAHGHYAAPASGAVLLILLNALRQLHHPRRANWLPWLSRAIVLALFLWMLVPISDRLWNPYSLDDVSGHPSVPKEIDRERLQSQLSRLPGQHLVLVHYGARDVPSKEWVYNRARIDSAKIVWARDMGRQANQELLNYFPNRRIWYVDRSSGSVIMPYATSIALSHPADALLPDAR
ncbi:MAG: hypothetical protein ABSD13_17760 [Candidatus Korobacteraceae bacterium]|jgi:hypothetical protein